MLDLTPVPDEAVVQVRHRFGELGVTRAPLVHHLWALHLEA